MHEWTNDCCSQCKSRHWMSDVSHSFVDFRYPTMGNYFETSHAKGPQDDAGANFKFQAHMTVIRRQSVIQNANDVQKFAE